MHKLCPTCKVTKPISDFNKRARSPDGYDYRCKLCQRETNKRWCSRNMQAKVDQQRQRRQDLAAKVRDYKTQSGCILCREDDGACLDLHHRDPDQKEIDPAGMSVAGWSWERMMTEIDKCVVLCANCHRKVHAGLITIL
jgi:hypothetical protein